MAKGPDGQELAHGSAVLRRGRPLCRGWGGARVLDRARRTPSLAPVQHHGLVRRGRAAKHACARRSPATGLEPPSSTPALATPGDRARGCAQPPELARLRTPLAGDRARCHARRANRAALLRSPLTGDRALCRVRQDSEPPGSARLHSPSHAPSPPSMSQAHVMNVLLVSVRHMRIRTTLAC